jgi:hypothetical protein
MRNFTQQTPLSNYWLFWLQKSVFSYTFTHSSPHWSFIVLFNVALNYNGILIYYVIGCSNAAREVHTSNKFYTQNFIYRKQFKHSNYDCESNKWILSQLHLAAFITRTNTALNMMVNVKLTAKSASYTLNCLDETYDVK